ncbi:PREDICTED: putative F-box protein At5g41510 [Camelina sativa]|uniref:F-box protein At5g41510 n=1 Tax=Camelina sativa TaxID=90675 RepID=A0ABM0Z1P0_CAMSA|nr:PREDICTED: putative F-box protein At5g41510 [Camelina sativa]
MTTTMVSNLLRYLIEEIISWLPLKSMKAVRLTCKSWDDLSKSESFRKKHIGKATRKGESMMIAMMPNNLYLMSGFVDEVDPSIEHKGQISFPSKQVSIDRLFHYEDLILCILKDVTRIVVWNPYLGQTRWINLRFSHRPYIWDSFSYGLGYEDKESCRSLKLLRFVDFLARAPEEQFFWYEIYNFDTGLWTTLDVAPHWRIYCSSSSVSLKGNSYWCAAERSAEGFTDRIICFDFTRERFGPLLPLPSCVRDRHYEYVTLSCVKEEKIAALFHHHDLYDYEIWITIKIEVEIVSWSKFLRIVDPSRKIDFPIGFFIDEKKKVFMSFGTQYKCEDRGLRERYINVGGEAGHVTKLDPGVPANELCRPDVCSYVPSVIQIKKPVRGKRIEQSHLEKRLCDQNRLRLAAFDKLLKKQNHIGFTV